MVSQLQSRPRSRQGTTWEEGRRLRAWVLHRQGWTNIDIAKALGVSRAAVGQWVRGAESGGKAALQAKLRPDPTSLLSDSQVKQLPELLAQGPEAFGFVGAFWTGARIARVIADEFGIAYSPRHVRRLLHSLDWSYHKPLVRASQRDEAAIERWLHETWPTLRKRAENEARTIIFLDESAFYMGPMVTKTWAPVGEVIELEGPLSRDHLSVIGGLTWDGSLYMQAQPTSLGSAGVIRFLRHLLQHIPGRILLLWDGARIHTSDEMREFLALDTVERLVHEHFPAYAPELDPQEYVWRQLKHVDLRNLTSYSLDELWVRMRAATKRLRSRVGLLKNLIEHAGLK